MLSVTLVGFILVGCASKERREAETRSSEKDDSSASGSIEKSVWYNFVIEGRHEGGWLTITLNGFPVEESTGMIRYRKSEVDLNTALIGEGNQLILRSEPLLLRGEEGVDVGDPGIFGRVRRGEKKISGARISASEIDSAYQAWKKRVQKQWEEYREWEKQWLKKHPEAKEKITWKDGGALDSIRAWAERNPLTVSTKFANEAGPDFSRIFEQAPRLPDTPATRERLKDYAMHLRELFVQEDTVGLYQEHKLSFQSNESSREKALNVIGTNWLKYDWHTDFRREDLMCRRWSDGRIWEIYRDDELSDRLSKQALFLAGEDRLAGWHKVYVAEIDGEFRVVR